ncbi:hypothetical protein ACU4GD_13670 [Cupriavidus basilensis]
MVLALALIGAAYIAQVMEAGFAADRAGPAQCGAGAGDDAVAGAVAGGAAAHAARHAAIVLGNVRVSLAKDTSLAYIVGVVELSTVATHIN